MAIVSNKARPWQTPDLHWHGNADEVHGAVPTDESGDGESGSGGGAVGSDLIIASGSTAARSLAERFTDFVSVFDFIDDADVRARITARTTTQADKDVINVAIDNATILLTSRSGGGVLWFPPGLYYAHDIKGKNNIIFRGSFGAVTIKRPNAVARPVFMNPDAEPNIPIDFSGFEGLIVDGNRANYPATTAVSAVAYGGCNALYVKNCVFQNATGYGFGLQSKLGTASDAPQTNIYMEQVGFINNGGGSTSVDGFDGLDIKDCTSCTLISCYADGNADTGIDVRGREVTILGGYSHNNGNFGYHAHVDSGGPGRLHYVGCYAEGNGPGTEGHGHGFYCRNYDGTQTDAVNVTFTDCIARNNTLDGFHSAQGQTLTLTCINCIADGNERHGFNIASTSILALQLISCVGRNNIGSGAFLSTVGQMVVGGRFVGNTRYGIEESTSSSGNVYGAGIVNKTNTLGPWLLNLASGTTATALVSESVLDYTPNSGTNGDIIASAAALTLPQGGRVFHITGTASITSITASSRGRIAHLRFLSTATVVDGGVLDLDGNFVAALDAVLTLLYDGTHWREISRRYPTTYGRGTQILAKSSVAIPHTGTAVETVKATIAIPANAMGSNGAIRVTAAWSHPNSAGSKFMRMRFGAVGSGLGGTVIGNAGATTTLAAREQREIHNRNATNSQICFASGTGGWGPTGVANVTTAIDTTAAVDITITAEISNTAETLTLEYYLVELIRP